MNSQPKCAKGEKGNVLFLILIAVALFAALAYAVTQSTRSGGGDMSSEKSLVSSAALSQYPASVKTAIAKMRKLNGIAVDDLTFDGPSNFAALDDSTAAKSKKNNVFYPNSGGGAAYGYAPADVMVSRTAGTWHFNGENEVKNIGTSIPVDAGSSVATADIIAFLPGVAQSACDRIHDQFGISKAYGIVAADISDMTSADPNIDAEGVTIGGTLAGQIQGCFKDGSTPANYTYYYVLVER